MVIGFGFFVLFLVVRGIIFDIFLLGLFLLIVIGLFVYKYYVIISSYLFLGVMLLMLFVLFVIGVGVFDIVMIGYFGVIIFVVLLGGIVLFGIVLFLVFF